MNRYAILTNRKRSIIALVHSVFFLLVALLSFLGQPKTGLLFLQMKPAGDWVMLGIYVVVTTILLILVRASSCARERLYFALRQLWTTPDCFRRRPHLHSAVCSRRNDGLCRADRLRHSQAPLANSN